PGKTQFVNITQLLDMTHNMIKTQKLLDKMSQEAYNIIDSIIRDQNSSKREKTVEERYYKPEDVMKLLGISKATLNRRAEDGTVPSELEEGKKRGRKYPKEAIDAHVKLLKPKDKPKLT